MSSKSLETRLRKLETAGQGDGPWAVYFDGDAYVTFQQQQVPLTEWQRRYPNGNLVRVRNVDGDEHISMGAELMKVLRGVSMRDI